MEKIKQILDENEDIKNWIEDENTRNSDITLCMKLGIQMVKSRAEDVMKSMIKIEMSGLVEDIKQDANKQFSESFKEESAKLKQRMEDLGKTISNLQTKNATSVGKGDIGENLVLQNLRHYFPEADIEDKSKSARQADIHITFQLSNKQHCKIMVESKNHSHSVATNEIEKFRNDFDNLQGFKCAILVSLGSGIVNKPMGYELRDGNKRIIFFLPNAGMDGGLSLISAVNFCKIFSLLSEEVIDYKLNEEFEKANSFFEF
eukprot:TRINITY_DN7280_c0_g1_i2.p1 TRINITY_DN7280_c0_g1~~TRINITY_DN7280_c0_g1_i2.p1  ORF type:complete len:260 (+),score=55.45 TRINITY_DN7280_c0_g1_i2:87-866(+)